MDSVPFDLRSAALAAGERLTGAARETAGAATHAGFAATQASMAKAAESAIFADALLGALKARLSELKSVAK